MSEPALDDDVETRLARLLAAYELDDRCGEALRTFLRVLAADEHAATTVREPAEALDRHVADGLSGLRAEPVRMARTLVDIGTGIGVPALMLAAARPELEVTAMDTVRRKTAWVAACAERMGLANVRTVHARAEDWPAGLRSFDVVAARAVAPLGVLVEYAAPLLRQGGALVAWKGTREEDEARVGRAAAAQLGLSAPVWERVQPWPRARDRHLVVSVKRRPTPKGFPRRPGEARRRPVGG